MLQEATERYPKMLSSLLDMHAKFRDDPSYALRRPMHIGQSRTDGSLRYSNALKE